MDFTLTEEQELVRTTARSMLGHECPPSLVRAHIDDPGAADELWDRHLREWVALGVGPLVDLALFLEEMGAVVAPGPYFATAALFMPVLEVLGHDLAPSVVAGDVTGTVALAGLDGQWHVNDDPVRTFVIEADRVDHVAVVGPRPGPAPGPAVVMVARDELGPALARVETLDTTRRVFTLDLADLADRVDLAERAVPIDPIALAGVLERATVALAAELIGTTRWMVLTAVAYAKERVQFDRPIGAFQGLQYKLVDMSLELERASAAVAYAAMAVDAADLDRHRAVPIAKAAAGRAAKRAAKDAMQVLGGIGYTWEHDLHLYLRRAYASDALLGPVSWHEDRLADLLFS